MTIAYIDCFSGAAGDMLLAALLDCGVDLTTLLDHLNSMHEIKGEWNLSVKQVHKGSARLAAKFITVESKHNHEPVEAPQEHDHSHAHDDEHRHMGDHFYSHSHVHQLPRKVDAERNFEDVSHIIQNSTLPKDVKEKAISVFKELAVAESRVHGCSLASIHFHEVGAIDSIIDTVGVVLGFYLLGVSEVHCSALPMSTGTVWCAHGALPVPAPATLLLMRGMQTTTAPASATGELVTPTAAALIRVLCGLPSLDSPIPSSDAVSGNQGAPPNCIIQRAGYGAGSKEFSEHPNVLRIIIGEQSDAEAPRKSSLSSSFSKMMCQETRSSFDHSVVDQGIYRHYKDQLYRVLGCAKNTETQEEFVIYQAMYGESSIWARPLSIWLDSVTLQNGNTVPRFQLELSNDDAPIAESSGSDFKSGLWLEQDMIILQANIDDMTPELIGHLVDKTISKGANDVWVENIIMKKNRPAFQINILCSVQDKSTYLEFIFREATTIGVRVLPIKRYALPRNIEVVKTSFGDVRFKVSSLGAEVITSKPEFDDCKKISSDCDIPLRIILEDAVKSRIKGDSTVIDK